MGQGVVVTETKREVLDGQANRIEGVFENHRLAVRVTGGMVSPRWVRFNLRLGTGVRLEKVRGLVEDLALGLNVGVCRVARQDGRVSLEIPRSDPQPISLLYLQKRLKESEEMPFCSATLGLSEEGAPLLVRLPSSQVAHLLIAGTTGSGKSALARTIILSLALNHHRGQLSFVLIDPKRRAFGPLAGLPHLIQPVVCDSDKAASVLQQLVQLMLQRDKTGVSKPCVVVVIDEVADLYVQNEATGQLITRLVQRGREAGIHVIACTQKPTKEALTPLAKANFPVRLVGQVTSPEEAKIATGYAGTGAEMLRGPGQFLAVAGGRVIRFDAAFVDAQSLAQVVTKLCQRVTSGVVDVKLPQAGVDVIDTGDKYSQWVEKVRPVWSTLIDSDGKVKYGKKADIAEMIFGEGKRSTAGHYGVVVNEVIKRLQNGDRVSRVVYNFQVGALSLRRVSRQKGRKTTTTTVSAYLERVFFWLGRRVKVVVVVSGPRCWTFRWMFPRLWAKSRLVFVVNAGDRWIVTRVL